MAISREQIDEACAVLVGRLGERRPVVGVILGSGLRAAQLDLADPLEIEMESIPHLPRPSVAGHGSAWTAGDLGGVSVLVSGGRVHGYEGVSLARATLGVRVMAALGCRFLVVTNAAGGIREDLVPGTLMRIRDHLNLLGDSPLVGPHDESLGARFVDMTEVYDSEWGSRVVSEAQRLGIGIVEGVYAAVLGPQYETPAEIRFLETIGADAVGMSTVPEVIVARQSGLRIFGLSLITNAAAGKSSQQLSHQEVLDIGRESAETLESLLVRIIAVTREL